MRNSLFLLLVVTGACQPAPAPDAAQPPTPVPEAPQALSDIRDYEWSIPEHADTSRTALMMGRPNSGDIIVTFWCAPGSGRLQMETFNNGSDAARLLFASGPTSETIDVTAVPADDFYGEGFIRVEPRDDRSRPCRFPQIRRAIEGRSALRASHRNAGGTRHHRKVFCALRTQMT